MLLGCNQRATYPGAPIIIISIDTLRADHLPVYGYRHVETPALDSLRRDSILFTNAYCSVPLTLPSHASMLTGLLPPDDNVRDNLGYQLAPSVLTIPKALKAKGYDTGAAVSAYVLRGSTGMGSSFDFYDDAIPAQAGAAIGSLQRSGSATEEIAKRWIGEHRQQPFLFFLHLFEPHAPYEPPEPFKSKYAANPYDGEIATADRIVGDFLDALKRSGIYEKASIILMSDHGEGLMQHGEPEHGIFLYRECIHVPLMLKLPHRARAGTTNDSIVGLIDIFPTIAELVEAKTPTLPGVSLLHPAKEKRAIYSESLYPRIHLGWSALRSLVDRQYHFIEAPRPELYAIQEDPDERKNIIEEHRRESASMRNALGGASIDMPSQISPEERRRLAALGYLTSSASVSGSTDPKDRIGEIAEMTTAVRLAQEGRHEEAIATLRKLLQRNPRFADAWEQLATSLEALGRYAEAAAAYRSAIKASPALANELGLRLGDILLKMGRYHEAAAQAHGNHMLLARIALARGNLTQAGDEARNAESDSTTRLQARLLEARIFSQQGQPERALTITAEITEPIESLDFVRGDALARMGRNDEAIAAFRREIDRFPRETQTYANLALVYFLLNRPRDAYDTLEQMARANPNPRTFEFAAHTLEELGDKRGATSWRARVRTSSRSRR